MWHARPAPRGWRTPQPSTRITWGGAAQPSGRAGRSLTKLTTKRSRGSRSSAARLRRRLRGLAPAPAEESQQRLGLPARQQARCVLRGGVQAFVALPDDSHLGEGQHHERRHRLLLGARALLGGVAHVHPADEAEGHARCAAVRFGAGRRGAAGCAAGARVAARPAPEGENPRAVIRLDDAGLYLPLDLLQLRREGERVDVRGHCLRGLDSRRHFRRQQQHVLASQLLRKRG